MSKLKCYDCHVTVIGSKPPYGEPINECRYIVFAHDIQEAIVRSQFRFYEDKRKHPKKFTGCTCGSVRVSIYDKGDKK